MRRWLDLRQTRSARIAACVLFGLTILLGWTGVQALVAARGRLWTAEAKASAGAVPVRPLLPAALSYGQEDRRAAEAALFAVIRLGAADRRLLLERIDPVPTDRALPAEIAADITVSGPEADVFRFARAIESAQPAIRFARWRIARTGPAETAVRLDARAMAVWEPR